MANTGVVIHFRDVENDEVVRDHIEKRCHRLGDEFHEILHMEITLTPSGPGHSAHGHVTGKGTDVNTHAEAEDVRAAADQMLDKVARQLRTLHDKRIFAQRREAQRAAPKRRIQGAE